MNKFGDYFVICGLDLNSGLEADILSGDNLHCSPLERPYKTKILAHYPENVQSNPFDASAVSMLALPNGLRFRTEKHTVTQAPVFHSFVITRENATRYYGFSLVFYEEVRNRDICQAMHILQSMYVTELSSGGVKPRSVQLTKHQQGPQSRSLPRHFKISAPVTPMASAAGAGPSLAYYDISKDHLFVSKSIAIVCRHAHAHAAKLFLENLYRCVPRRSATSSGGGNSQGSAAGASVTAVPLSLESYVFNLLYEVEVPLAGKSLLVHLPPSDPLLPLVTAVLQTPAPPLELPHLDFPMRFMFLWLGVDIVIQLFTCLLLEHQLLLRSTDCQKLMVVAECITALLFPFSWPHVYVPILPASLHHFLDAPVPFVMGLYATYENIKVGSEATLCFVDIDKCKIQLPEEMVALPHLEPFMAEIYAALDKCGVHVPDADNSRIGQEIMSRSCTLPGRPQNRRKLSIHDNLDNERPPSPPGSARTEALQRIADIVRRTGVTLEQNDTGHQPIDSYHEDLRLNNSIREIFLNRFVHMLQSYENFVIVPNQDKEDWFNNRETMQNFDKASFLSDQPEQHRRFLSRLLESQMFATLIDNKILSTWDEMDANLKIFDNRLKLLKQRYGGENRSICEPCTCAHDTQRLLDRRLNNPDFETPKPREILTGNSNSLSGCSAPSTLGHLRHFPVLDRETLNKTPVVNKGSIPRASIFKRSSSRNNTLEKVQLVIQKLESMSANKENNQTAMSSALIAENNWSFVEKLLKDCKLKTKRMLLAKLGAEGVTLSSSNADGGSSGGSSNSFGAVEESTLVASLCDFLERVWSHGLQKRRGKSALWCHLLAYQETRNNGPGAQQYMLSNEMSRLVLRSENWSQGNDNRNMRTDLQPLPESLLFDVSNIQLMLDVKTGIGMARAWVRLALEKKQLSKHLRNLLQDQNLLRSQYKRSAFLRCEEEKEQFLYHLLSLNAVDYFCFTSTYPTTVIPYRIIIHPSRKGTISSANVWIVLSGTLSETKRIKLPKQTLNYEYRHSNLGVLTTMRIGHDNTGLSAKWMIDVILIRNEFTGHLYKFPCGRWLGRGVDDGSIERLLVGSLLPRHEAAEEESGGVGTASTGSTGPNGSSGGGSSGGSANGAGTSTSGSITVAMSTSITGSLGRRTPRSQSPAPPRTELKPSQIQHMLGDCVNNIVKWQYRRNSERNTTLTALLCGEAGLVKCLELVFLSGFKSARLFVFNHYLWDYFVRVKEQFEIDLMEETSGLRNTNQDRNYQETMAVWRCYCHLVDEIHHTSKALGKDGKFQLFICLSVREHLLHRMLMPMALCKITLEMYEDNSFLRNRGLLTFLRQILLPLDELDVVLENSVTHGIASPQ